MPEADTPEFDYAVVIDGKRYDINVEDLELGELEVMEEACDCAIDDIDWNRASTLRALAFIVKHREDSSFSMDDARRLTLKRFRPVDEPKADPAKPVGAKRPTRAAKPKAASKAG